MEALLYWHFCAHVRLIGSFQNCCKIPVCCSISSNVEHPLHFPLLLWYFLCAGSVFFVKSIINSALSVSANFLHCQNYVVAFAWCHTSVPLLFKSIPCPDPLHMLLLWSLVHLMARHLPSCCSESSCTADPHGLLVLILMTACINTYFYLLRLLLQLSGLLLLNIVYCMQSHVYCCVHVWQVMSLVPLSCSVDPL